MFYVSVSQSDGFYRLNGTFSGCFPFFARYAMMFFQKSIYYQSLFFIGTKMENSFLISHGQLKMRAEMSLPDFRTLTTRSYSSQASKLIKKMKLTKVYILLFVHKYCSEFLFHCLLPAILSLRFIFCSSCNFSPHLFNSSTGPSIVNCSPKFGFAQTCLPDQELTGQGSK